MSNNANNANAQLIGDYLNAGYPAVFVSSVDELQTFAEITAGADGRRVLTYSSAGELIENGQTVERCNWAQAFEYVAVNQDCVLICSDAQHVCRNPAFVRGLLQWLQRIKTAGNSAVFVAPNWQLPQELAHVAPVVELELPGRNAMREPLQTIADSAGVAMESVDVDNVLDACAGLTLFEAENALALSFYKTGQLSADVVAAEKMRTLNSSGILHVEKPKPVDALGGLGRLKTYVQTEVLPVIRDEQLRCRGFVLCSLPGNGKSLAAKVTASILQRPLIRFDVSAVKGKFVGESEGNMRNAIAILNAFGPCVLWVDEIEKALGGNVANATDGGASAGVLGTFLTWLQEHTADVLTVATCNNFSALPPELTRAGRFDERFVVDLPTATERAAIAAVHLQRFGCPVELAGTVAELTADYTGAEIEQTVKSAARLTMRNVDAEALRVAALSIRPIARIDAESVAEFRQWSLRALRIANDETEADAGNPAGVPADNSPQRNGRVLRSALAN